MNAWSHTIYDWDEIVVPNELGVAGPERAKPLLLAFQSTTWFQSKVCKTSRWKRQSSRSTILKRL